MGNILTFRNRRQKYTLSGEFNVNVSANQQTAVYNVFKLGTHETLYYHKNNQIQKIAQGNISLFVDDTENKWQLNQSMTFAFIDEVDMQNFGFIAYTDSTNQFNLTTNYQKLIGVVSSVTTLKPVIEIICVDNINYKFIIISK